MKILVVDNEEQNLEATRNQFDVSDEVVYCDTYQEAKWKLLDEKFDIVAVRYYWHEFDGYTKKFRYAPVGLRIALDALAVGTRTVIVKNLFMQTEDMRDVNKIFEDSLTFLKAGVQGMIQIEDMLIGNYEGDQLNWPKCIKSTCDHNESKYRDYKRYFRGEARAKKLMGE